MKIRKLTEDDLSLFKLCRKLDKVLSKTTFESKVSRGEYYVLIDNGKVKSVLRVGEEFRTNIPTVYFIKTKKLSRRKKYATKLLRFWEKENIEKGEKILHIKFNDNIKFIEFVKKNSYIFNAKEKIFVKEV